jgi:hypothetical protein
MRNKYLLLSFFVPLIVRAIPEVVSFPWPIGYDTVDFYAPFIQLCQVYGYLPTLYYYIFEQLNPFLFLALIDGIGVLSGADPLLIIKIVVPFISGFLGFSVFYFCNHFLEWKDEKSLFCAVLSSVYFVSLALEGDYFRNVLGLGFFFLAISETKRLDTKRGFALFLVFTLLCVSSHDVVTAILLVVVAYLILAWFYDKWKVKVPGQKSVLAGLSSGGIICAAFAVFYAGKFSAPGSAISTAEYSSLTDYLFWNPGSLSSFPTYIYLGHIILFFFLFLFAPLLLFTSFGYFKCRPLDAATLLLLFASFMPLVLPYSALPYWYRWMIMLSFPFTIYASNSLFWSGEETIAMKILKFASNRSKRLYHNGNHFSVRIMPKLSNRKVVFVFVILVSLLSFTYIVFPYEQPFPYFTNSEIQLYFAPTMQYNTLPISESIDAVLATTWLNWNMPANSCLITNDRLHGWAELYVHFRPIYEYEAFNTNLSNALQSASAYNTTFVITTWIYDYYIKTAGFNLVFNLGEVEVFKK